MQWLDQQDFHQNAGTELSADGGSLREEAELSEVPPDDVSRLHCRLREPKGLGMYPLLYVLAMLLPYTARVGRQALNTMLLEI